MQRVLFLACVLPCALACALHASYVSPEDLDNVCKAVSAESRSLRTAHHAVTALASVDRLSHIDATSVCKQLPPAPDKAGDLKLRPAYHSLTLLKHLTCPDPEGRLASAVRAVGTAALPKATTIPEMLMALAAAGPDASGKAHGMVARLTKLHVSSGRFKDSRDKDVSVAATGRAYALLAALQGAGADVGALRASAVAGAPKLLASVGPSGLTLTGDSSPQEAASELLQGLAALGVRDLPAAHLTALVTALLAHRAAAAPQNVAWLLTGLTALQADSLPPVATLSLHREGPVLHAAVAGVWGDPLPGAVVSVQGLDMRPSSPGRFEGSLTGLPVGEKRLTAAVSFPEGGFAPLEGANTVVVEGRLSLKEVAVGVAGGPARTLRRSEQPGGLPALTHAQSLQVSFRPATHPAGIQPQQAVLCLTHTATGRVAIFHAAPEADGEFGAVADMAGVKQQIGALAGAFTASLRLGDTRLEPALDWTLGALLVDHTSKSGVTPKPPTGETGPQRGPKPVLTHTHAMAVRQPPAVLSVLFGALSCLPCVGFVLSIPRLGGNMRGLPRSGGGAALVWLFHGCVAGIMGLLVLYWLRLNALSLITPLAVATAATSLIGWRALRHVSRTRRLKVD